MPDTALGVAAKSFDSHKMHNFVDLDANGKQDRSVLADPRMHQRAEDNRRMIDEYRSDMLDLREGVTRARAAPIAMRSMPSISLRGPLQLGEPARREQGAAKGTPRCALTIRAWRPLALSGC
jgi:hypothetical protein